MKKTSSKLSIAQMIAVLFLISAAFSCGSSSSDPGSNQEPSDYYWWTGFTISRDLDSDGTVDTLYYVKEYDSLGRITRTSETYTTPSGYPHNIIIEYSDDGNTTTATINRYSGSDDSPYSKDVVAIENGRKVEYYEAGGDYDHNGTIDLDDTEQYHLFTYDSQGRPLAQHSFIANRVQDDTDPDYGKVASYRHKYYTFEYDDAINKISRLNYYSAPISLSSNSNFLDSKPSLDTVPEMTASELRSYHIYSYDSQGNIISETYWNTFQSDDYDIYSKYLYFYDSMGRMSEQRYLRDIDGDGTVLDTETDNYTIYTYDGTEETATSYATDGSTIATSSDMTAISVNTYRNESDLLEFNKSGTFLTSLTYKDKNSDGVISLSDEDFFSNVSCTYEINSFTPDELKNIQYENYIIKYSNYNASVDSLIDNYK